jgi:hypothetical protein
VVHCGGNLDWLRETGLILPVPIDTPQVAIDALAASVLHLAVSSRRPKWSLRAVVAGGGYMERWIMAERGQVPAARMVFEASDRSGCPA